MHPRRLALACLLLSAAALAGCARKPPEPVKTPPPVVYVAEPVVRTVTEYEDFAGRTEPFKVVELKSRVTGNLKRIHFTDGQDIEEGTPLFDLDSRIYRAQLEQAARTLGKAEAHLKTAADNYVRARQLYESGAGGREDYEVKAGEKAEADADVKALRAARDLAATNLRYCRITAPFDGRLSKRFVYEDALVKADDTTLTTIVQLDRLYATFDVDERTVTRIRRLIADGAATSSRVEPLVVQVGLADDDEFALTGRVVFTDNQFDVGTGTLRVRAVVLNPRLPGPPHYLLSPGQFVRVRIPIGRPREAVLVPEKAIGSDQGQKFVYVVGTKNEVERRNIKAGQLYGALRVVENGAVRPGETIIVDGLLRVRPGGEVNPKPDPTPKPTPVAARPRPEAPAPRPVKKTAAD